MLTELDAALSEGRARKGLPHPAERRRLREQAGLSQLQLAQALNVTQPALSRWERGLQTPRGDLARRYLEALERLAGEIGR